MTAIGDPEATARRAIAELRDAGAEVVIALTHLEAEQDAELLQALGPQGLDLVVGGHDHQAMALEVDGRWVLKADADAVTAQVIEVTLPAAGAHRRHRGSRTTSSSSAPPRHSRTRRWRR